MNNSYAYHIDSEQVETCQRISSHCTKWFKGVFLSLRSSLSSDLGLDSFEYCFLQILKVCKKTRYE